MDYWDTPPMDRRQIALFAPSLDQNIGEGHPVRLVDEILRGLEWSEWESHYHGAMGRPPIHPRVMASLILYGLTLGVRSSRKLQDACLNRLDFIWLGEGRQIDHSTFAEFRTRFGPQIRAMFRQLVRVAMEVGVVRLNQVAFDGTMVKADNGRYNTARIKEVEAALEKVDRQVQQMLDQAQEEDRRDAGLYGAESSPGKLPRELADLKKRQRALGEAMEALKAMEARRAGRKDVSRKGPQVPLADVDARVLPNKDGGYAPNYVPILGVDGPSGLLVSAGLAAGNDEAGALVGAVEQIQKDLGRSPQQVLADGGFHTGPNLVGLEAQGIEALIPERQRAAENPATDPGRAVVEPQPQAGAVDAAAGEAAPPQAPAEAGSQAAPAEAGSRAQAGGPPALRLGPVPAEDWDKLPINPQQKVLDKAAFVYDEAADRYICPMGQGLEFRGTRRYEREGCSGLYRVYEGPESVCASCPLRGRCYKGKTGARQVLRDEYQAARDRAAARMASPQGKADYRRRWPLAETPFGILKTVMGFRRFLLRGRERVETELNWVATAFNLRKLARLRAAARVPAVAGCVG